MLLLLAACASDPVPSDYVDLLDEWWFSRDEAVPYMGVPSCGFLGSDYEAIIGDEEQTMYGRWHAEGEVIVLSHSIFHIGELVFDRLDSSSWLVTWDGNGYHGTTEVQRGCPLLED